MPVFTGKLTLPTARQVGQVRVRLWTWFGISYTGVLLMAVVPTSAGLTGLGFILFFAGSIGLAFAIVDWFRVRSVRRFANLVPIRDLAARTGAPELTYLLATRQKGIMPRCIIQGTEYYDVNELGDAGILLRPAETPVLPDQLLRPAAGSSRQDENLVRPSQPD